LRQQRREQAEMGRPLDRPGAEAELLGHGVVVDRRVATVFLLRQHLPRRPQRSLQDQRRIEAHLGLPCSLDLAGRPQITSVADAAMD
jgi:hypothetical protein